MGGRTQSPVGAKEGTQKKLTADETAKVNAQLKKEAGIRENVRQIAAQSLRGFGIVKALAIGPPSDASRWMGTAVGATSRPSTRAPRLSRGTLGQWRSLPAQTRPPHVSAPSAHSLEPPHSEPAMFLRSQTPSPRSQSRIWSPESCYRLRFAGEQRPFDTVSLIYVLSLVLLVLEKGGFSENAEERDTQLVLAIEILSFHTDSAADEAIPRAEILAALVSSMQKYNQHYKIIKDCFSDTVRCVAPNMTAEEIGVLSRGAIVPQASVRSAVLQAISAEVDMSDVGVSEEIWLACHDDIEENVDLGREIWEESEFQTSEELAHKMPAVMLRARTSNSAVPGRPKVTQPRRPSEHPSVPVTPGPR